MINTYDIFFGLAQNFIFIKFAIVDRETIMKITDSNCYNEATIIH